MEKGKNKTAYIEELNNYFKYLYEEEKDRTDKINSATNTYLVFITFAFSFGSGFLGWFSSNISPSIFSFSSPGRIIAIAIFGIAVIFLVISLVFTVLVVKVRNFERLCDPEEFAKEAMNYSGLDDLFGLIIANYIVALDRNFLVNNKKTRYLTRGLVTYLVGLLLMFAGFALLSIFA
jgi:hypothetical protein